VRLLNREVLPARCLAEAQVHVGSRVEVDVAALDQGDLVSGNGGGVATAIAPWAPPATALVMPAIFPDEVEVQIFDHGTGMTLVAAVELISPGNKDRPESRRAFAAKCATYLHQGIGLVIVDIVTSRLANLHDELIGLLRQPETFAFSPDSPSVYAVAYRPNRTTVAGDRIEIWPMPLGVGQPLPVLPLALRGLLTVPLDLDTTYRTACEDSRLSVASLRPVDRPAELPS
jgi:hypothetical protein